MPTRPLPAQTIFNTIPFGLLFVEHDTIRYANQQAHSILRRPYLEQTLMTELVPDYKNQLRHTVYVENIPILAHKLPLSASTQAVVIRYAFFDLPLVCERFINDRLTSITRIFEQLALVDQAELNQTQAEMVSSIKLNALTLERLHYPLLAWQQVLKQDQTTQLIKLESWLPQQLATWQAQAQSHQITFEVVYDPTSSFTMIEAALLTIIEQLLTNAFQQTAPTGTIKLQILVESTSLRITVFDSGPHPSNEYRLPWHDHLSIQIVGAWANLLQAEFFYVAEDPLGNTITINIPSPSPLTIQHNFTTLGDLLEHVPLPLELFDSQANVVWYNSAASHYNQQPKRSYSWPEEAIPTSQPMYFGTEFNIYPQIIENLDHLDLTLSVIDPTSLLQGLYSGVSRINVYSPCTPIQGFSDLLRLGHMGPISQELSKIFTEISRLTKLISQSSQYYTQLVNAFDVDKRDNPYPSENLASEFENLFNSFNESCTPRNITLQLDFPTFPQHKFIQLYPSSIFRQVLENAIQAAPPGTAVTVRAREYENGLLFQIHDHGAGIPQAEQTHVSEFFWRNPQNYAAPLDEPRLGCGLAIATITIHAANGWMQHKSDEHGTTCTVWLPFQE